MKQKWKVFEIRVKMYLLQDISFKENRYKFYSIGT